ncbi:MAG: phospho-N-acetylmuramoyl-pentapeptide-transferase [Spirochaetales bacterium]|jgi:phospho-N-acetylmuramoyl-pentapeptide-transferase|nr:phospho-N-acetylmuramoyl-pentapeptide-transferase [Spirochaetales bacterium]
MFKQFLLPLVNVFSFFNIFQYITFRAAYAAVTSLFLSLCFGPYLIKTLKGWKLTQAIRADGPQSHLAKSGTPTMGGLLILFSVFVSMILWQDFFNWQVWLALGAFLLFGAIGFLDDYLKISRKNSDGLRPRLKLLLQLILSLGIVLVLYFNRNEQTTRLYIPFFKNAVLDLSWFYIPFGMLYLTGLSNAVNLTDGLDGLASGLLLLVTVALGVLCYITGRSDFSAYLQVPYIAGTGELAVVSLALAGACIGFLWHNAPPADLFMGDTGSLALGGVIGTLALLIKKEILILIVGGVFVIEMLSVIIQVVWFKWKGKRLLLMSPLHHHYELKGTQESRLVIRFWILGGLFLILSLSTLKLQ